MTWKERKNRKAVKKLFFLEPFKAFKLQRKKKKMKIERHLVHEMTSFLISRGLLFFACLCRTKLAFPIDLKMLSFLVFSRLSVCMLSQSFVGKVYWIDSWKRKEEDIESVSSCMENEHLICHIGFCFYSFRSFSLRASRLLLGVAS